MSRALRILAPALVLVLHIALLQSYGALACAGAFPQTVPWAVAAITAVAAAILVAVFVRGLRRRRDIADVAAPALAAVALVVMLWQVLPLYMIPLCE